jgi:hypothetical protein
MRDIKPITNTFITQANMIRLSRLSPDVMGDGIGPEPDTAAKGRPCFEAISREVILPQFAAKRLIDLTRWRH